MVRRLRFVFLVLLAALGIFAGTAGSALAAPANDNFAARQTITGPLPLTVAANNIEATAEVGEQSIGGNAPLTSIWFSWTAPNANKVAIDLCAVEFPDDSQPFVGMAVRTGATLGAQVLVTETAGRCTLRLTPVAGTTYNFQIDFRNNEGNFNLLFRQLAPPANDNFATPTNLGSALPVNQPATTIDSGWEVGEPASLGGTTSSRSVWFTWTAPANGRIRVTQCETTYYDGALNRAVIVYTGATLGTLAVVSSMTSTDCAQDLTVVAGTTYRIAVSGNIQGEFDFVLDLKSAPAPTNDNFATPQVVGPALPVSLNGDNDFATEEAGEPDHGGYPDTSRSLWYSWTADQSGPTRVRACGKGLQHFSSVYTGAALAALTEVGERFYYAPCSNFFDAVAGTTYLIAVAGGPFTDWHGPFEFSIRRVAIPANDAFGSAVNLGSGLAISANGTTVDSTLEDDEPSHSYYSGADGGSVWYRWTAPSDNAAILSACSTGEPNRLAVYSDNPEAEVPGIGGLLQIDEDGVACRDGQSGGRLAIAPVKGTVYYIAVTPMVEDYESAFTLKINTPPVKVAPAPFNLKKAIAKCKKIKGTGKKAKRKRANCIKAARKKAAIIKCKKISKPNKRNVCIKKARKKFR